MADPRFAATIVTLRAASSGAPELFLVKRHSKSSFFANAYVYPGGHVEPTDSDPALIARVRGLTPEDAAARLHTTPTDAIRHYIAAARESFEEAGLLLAVDAHGQPLTDLDRIAALRVAKNAGERSFLEVLVELDAWLMLADIGYIAHWVTPPAEPLRFDTRFFITVLPRTSQLAHDEYEMVSGRWITAEDAIAAYYAGEIELAPPTLITLEQLRRCGELDAIQAWGRAPVTAPIMPALTQIEDEPTLILPGDPLAEPGTPPDAALPATRMILRDGRWRLPQGS
jgi:8-oxo-dGTP pyrophosphatase MutT (NUDIX family)